MAERVLASRPMAKELPNKIGKNHLFNPRPIGKTTIERSISRLFSLRRGLFRPLRAWSSAALPLESSDSKRAVDGGKTLDREREVIDRTQVNIRRPRLSWDILMAQPVGPVGIIAAYRLL